MKIIVPLAGKGTRLLPLTKRVPKPLVRVAGRPVLDYVMDLLLPLEPTELIVITGHLKEGVESYISSHYDVRTQFVEQQEQDGTAGAVKLAQPWVDEPVLIVFVDTVFEADLSLVRKTDADGIIWVKEVEDYQRFGVVVTDGKGSMTRIVEKPAEPVSKLANIGLYYIRDWQTLFEGIDDTLTKPRLKGEWFLTDAFQYMIDHGKRIRTAEVKGWYDCGKVATLLETNEHLLRHGGRGTSKHRDFPGTKIVPPVRIEEGVTIEHSTIGPNVTLEAGCVVKGSIVEHAIVGRGSQLDKAILRRSVVGESQQVLERTVEKLVVDGGEFASAR
jgi:glucose-1-phosphate thymidylyltransferase